MPVSLPSGPLTGAEAELVHRRLALLHRASELLASSLDYEAAARQIAWLGVPELADWCAVYLLDGNESGARIAVAYTDPAQASLASAVEQADPLRPGEALGVLRVLDLGRPVLMARVGDAELAWLARGPAHLQLLRRAGLRSVLCIPLSARGRYVGALSLATTTSGRTYTDVDVALAEEFARCCAVAVDNARLHRETVDALRRKDDALVLLDSLLSAAPDGFGFVDTELRWVKLNEALAAALGTPVQQLLGQSVAEVGVGCFSSVEQFLRCVLETGEPLVDRELSNASTAPRCQPRHYLMSVYPFRKPSGEMLGVGIVTVDITARKNAEDELRQSEERFRKLVETANEGIWLIDTQTRTTFINQRMAAMLGYQAAEIEGQSVLDFTADQSGARERIRRTLAGSSEQSEFPFRHRDGSTVLVLGGTSPVTNSHGAVVGALGVFVDITDRAEAEAVRGHLALLAGASELLASSLDYEATLRQIVWLAVPELADWCAIFRVEPGETPRLGALAYADPAHASLAQAVQRTRRPLLQWSPSVLQEGRAEVVPDVTDEFLQARAADEEALRLLRSMALRSRMHLPMRARGRIVGVLALATAESGRCYGPADVGLAQQLADRFAAALDNAVLVGELRRALGVREELLAATSHELRTPLAHIKGFISTLRQPDVEWDEATRQDLLAEVEREADRLNGLIGDLLNMSRVESQSPEQHPRAATAPKALVSAGLDRVRGLLGQARVQVDVPASLPPVVVDAAQLEQVVANLVENACKYGGSNVQLRITAALVGGDLELAVEDDGPGIPEEDLLHVFEKFFRVRGTEQSGVPGTGLGLAICRSIILAHGGHIWAENRPSGGTRFVVRLPLDGRAPGTS